MKEKGTYIVSGGGTGGHIYPALAVADAIRERSGAEIFFVGAKGKMEMEKVPRHGYPIKGLWISGLQRKKILVNLLFPLKMLSSLWVAFGIIRKTKPLAVLGTGGFASGPMALMASWMKIPVYVQEQNSYPGITNKFLSKYARKVFVAYPGMDAYFNKQKVVVSGNPIRNDIPLETTDRVELKRGFGLKENDAEVLLVLGGSLGARSINNFWKKHLAAYVESGHQIIWQTGKFYYQDCKEVVEGLNNPNISLQEFIYDMPSAYALADLVISRAGALSISELSAAGKPVILIPSPNVAEDHQYKNALVLNKNNAAKVLRESEMDKLLALTLGLMASKEEREELSENIAAMAKKNAAMEIAKTIIDEVGN